jgi:RNA polymerase sigma-70 factor (ECF subfamily)
MAENAARDATWATPSLSVVADDEPERERVASRAPAGATSSRAPRDAVPDAVLAARVVADDDRHAFAELVRRHQSALRALLRRLTRGNHALADDLAQDAFLQVYRKLAQFRGDARFATWLYRIGYNCFLAHARAARIEEPLPEEFDGDGAHERRAADDSAMRLDVARALDALPESERTAIIHCYYLDLSHEEAAYILQCPLGTLKTHVLRGKQRLKRLLGAWAPDAETDHTR